MDNPIPKERKTGPLAVALCYDEKTMSAPAVSAVAEQNLVKTVYGIARRYGIPVQENMKLASQLADLELDEEIPAEFYSEVAALMGKIDNRRTR